MISLAQPILCPPANAQIMNMPKKMPPTDYRPDTTLTHSGNHPRDNNGFVNPVVVHASTVLFPDVATMLSGKQPYVYGRRGTPTTAALEEAVTELEGAAGTALAPSGLGAITLACMSCLSAGDHMLVADTVYGPTRNLCDKMLTRFGVDISYYDPQETGGLVGLIRKNTKAIFTESPGSLTFEMQDIPAVVKVARAHDLLVIMDNTWATPLYYKPIEHGVDLSLQAGTKYIVGHSDVMIGTVAASERAWPALKATHGDMGLHVGPDDVYLALRGLRTMGVRLERHMKSTLEIASWLEARDDVTRVLYPALPSFPGHDLWKRDFTGASGLFSFELKPTNEKAVHAFLDALSLFGLGFSWGGYESLALWARPQGGRTATTWNAPGPLIRLHIGLEDTRDLIGDLEIAFKAFHAAG